ncbi:MAG TPA: undecaprenyl-diphosphate phosphatase [Bacteroidales bacterium]|nr:undecaprenyl-diphosphate phosphatase [Bacteroidales bacterium]HPS17537.1 undecaprenyl-diphosphate phosphatase [Bacteroidales bacterium]
MSYLQAIIIAIVEGITEFLPISSTGHMIITQSILGVPYTDFVKAFTVNIQFGAILSVIILYWKKFFQSLNFYYKLLVAFIPAAVIGFLLGDYIDALLENVVVVAISLVAGGVILLFVDNWFKNSDEKQKDISYLQALKIGFFQCIAMIPGVSRSAATIVGGMSQKLSRKHAAEFSFFLAVPTMFAASAYKLLKTYEVFDASNIKVLIVGNVVAFIVAMVAIKGFITFLTKYGFKAFGYYRIIVGLLILILLAFNIPLQIS